MAGVAGDTAADLNIFFSRLEALLQQSSLKPAQFHPAPGSKPLTVQVWDVEQVLSRVNTRKAAGPDGVPGKVLKACAHQLSEVFTTIFNLSLAQVTIPACLKSAIIITIPKKPATNQLNNFRPVALTPIITKCLEQLVLRHIKDSLRPNAFC